ncbi:xanthine dehydrogenase/oxidase-like [Littorina saxatilis]|uniref:xanthine dehydrogenase/oxidase-like n=1 Tax=Littorina saxatilis TaxID=31220 RepID=UPI0038B45341
MLPFLPSVKCPACDVSHTPLAGQLKNGVYAGSCQNCGYFFKFRAVEDTADTVTFSVNGAQYTVGNEFDPATSLNEWLRSQQVSTGTKQMCLEGGCGVCLVSVQLYEPVSGTKQVYTVNSCLVQLYMCDGWEVTTIEGLGNPADGLHPVQQRLVDYNGSQCGFCSPGQVMNMYGFLQRNPKPTKQQVEDNFDATICRCTGYRPILDAMKSFAVDTIPSQHGGPLDIEDLNPKVCKTTNKPCRRRCRPKTKDDANTGPSGSVPLHIVGERAQWLKPTTLQALCALLKQYGGANYRLVFGNTGYGVYKELGPWMYDILIDIRGVQDFYRMETSPSVVVGANLSLTNLREMFERHASDPSTVTYFPDFARHVKQVASNSVRNLACWAGNLMLKHTHPDFVSDVFTLFETVGAQLNIVDGEGKESSVNLTDFLTTDLKGKVVVSAILPTFSTDDVYIRTFRVAQRLQLSHGYVVAGFNFQLDKNDNFRVKVKPSIVFQGINATTNHATTTEDFLTGKQLGDPAILQEALTTLGQEMKPSSEPILASPEYRQNLACSLFYKFVLNTCADKCQKRYQSGGTGLYRPVSSAVQTFDSRKEEWPLNQPMTKLDAAYQVCGEARYVDDLPLEQTELYATFVISTKGNAKLASMDPSAALAMSGVYKFIQASDIPTGGTNSFTAPTGGIKPEEFLCSGQVLYAGQPLAIIVAADPQTAETAASMVKVTYADGQRPLSDMKEAIKQKSFFPGVLAPRVVGDPDQAIAQSARRITGTIECGLQAHFHLETQNGRCAPDDDGGMHVQCTTQDIGVTAQVVARILNIPQSAVTVEVKRLGGAFGAKNLRNGMATGACALAAHIMRRPIRLCMNFHTNLKSVGKRHPYYAQYEIGFTEEGKLNGVSVTAYANCGSSPNENLMGAVFDNIDNAYHCENWRVTPIAVKTNTACNASCRGPGSLPTHFITESMMDHVAKTLGKDPSDVRKVNLYTKGQVTPGGKRLDYCNIAALVSQLEASSGFQVRKQQVALFNQANRWKKRGISMIPVRYGIGLGSHYNVFVAIYGSDGTIAIDHGGIEMGQGVNTKVAQVCAYELGVPMSLIRVKKSSSTTNANSSGSNSSHTSELTAMGVIECCKTLKSRMDPIRLQMDKPSWTQLVSECYKKGVDLSATAYTVATSSSGSGYNVYAAIVTEAEVDILTGQSQILRSDLLYDCGESLNPELDIGQIEGGFMMGLGYHLTEKVKFDPTTGEVLTDGTWEYTPPMPKNLPINFRVTLLKNAPNPVGVLRSKTAGEPPLMLSSSAVFAIKQAVEAARAEIGQDVFFTLNSPVFAEDIQAACMVKPSQFTFGQ